MKTATLRVILFTIGFILLSGLPLSAQSALDWGGFVDSTTDYTNLPKDEFTEELNSGLWMEAILSDSFKLSMRGSYTYDDTRDYFFDLDHLYAKGRVLTGGRGGAASKLFRYTAGRFRLKEFTGYVFNHTIDGAHVAFEHPWFSLEVGGGYTGLIFIPSSSIIITQSDLLLQADIPDNGYKLASPKTIETAKMTFPGLLLNQDLILNGVFMQDLQPKEDMIRDDDIIHAEYAGIGFKGGIINSVYQDIFFYYNYGHGKYTTSAFLFGGGLRYYNRPFYFSRVGIRGLYSSGDNDQEKFYGGYNGGGTSHHFIGISSSPQSGLVFSPSIGNFSLLELNLSMKPLSKSGSRVFEEFQTALTGLVFFRNTGGAISVSGINGASEENYLGSELDLTLNFRPLSDLGIGLSGGVFFPNDNDEKSAFLEYDEDYEMKVRLNVSFSF